MFCRTNTKGDCYFIVEDRFCCLIINVKFELKPNKDLLPIIFPSSPAIANIFVVGSFISVLRSLLIGNLYLVMH